MTIQESLDASTLSCEIDSNGRDGQIRHSGCVPCMQAGISGPIQTRHVPAFRPRQKSGIDECVCALATTASAVAHPPTKLACLSDHECWSSRLIALKVWRAASQHYFIHRFIRIHSRSQMPGSMICTLEIRQRHHHQRQLVPCNPPLFGRLM
jgi:hypothetical protein